MFVCTCVRVYFVWIRFFSSLFFLFLRFCQPISFFHLCRSSTWWSDCRDYTFPLKKCEGYCVENVFEFHFEHNRVMANYLYTLNFVCENMHFMVWLRFVVKLSLPPICKTIEEWIYHNVTGEQTEKYFSSYEWLSRSL